MGSLSSSYYFALTTGYAVAIAGWLLMNSRFQWIWKSDTDYQFEHPWKETLYAILAALATVGLGQLYSQGFFRGWKSLPLSGVLDQILIFLPFPLLLVLRKQPLSTAWLSAQALLPRLAVGFVLALLALALFVAVRNPDKSLLTISASVCHLSNLGYASQTFLQDVSVAILLVRLRSALGSKKFLIAVVAVAFAFSATHYPLKLKEGLSIFTSTRDILLDGILVSTVIYVLQRSKDILWFWPVHFTMDMMQLYAGDPKL